ncbi:hypothetical protein R6Q59_018880 [Mikania micrantha]
MRRGITTPAVKPTVLVIDGSENAPEVKFRVVRKRTCDSLLQSEVLGRKRRFGLLNWICDQAAEGAKLQVLQVSLVLISMPTDLAWLLARENGP